MIEAFVGDPAATDSTRVLRLPGSDSNKYQEDYRVAARELSTAAYRLSDFKLGERQAEMHELGKATAHSCRSGATAKLTPSDHDWRWAQDRLRSGGSISVLIQRLEDYRYDKPSPQYYARRTVTKKSGPQLGIDAHAARRHQITTQSQNPRHKNRGVLFWRT